MTPVLHNLSNSTSPCTNNAYIADTGASAHFVPSSTNAVTTSTRCVTVGLPNGATIQSHQTTPLDIASVPIAAATAHVMPELTRGLVSIGQLCDADCTAAFTKELCTVRHHDNVILSGPRDHSSGLWTLPSITAKAHCRPAESMLCATTAPRTLYAFNAFEHKTKQDLATYLHRCCFCPAPSTWITAIAAGYFTTWPGLTVDLVIKHLPKSDASIKGHLRQQYQNIRSTKPPPTPSATEPTHLVYSTTFDPTGKIYTDQTGRFPAISSRGHKCIMICYAYDCNAILAEPLKSRTGDELTKAYGKIHALLTQRGFRPQLQKLDNEAPASLKQFLIEQSVDYQLVPPHVHRRNSAERAISTFKDHFLAGLCSANSKFPVHLWDRLIPQCVETLNMLRASRLNNKLSAYTQLNGVFDFNRTPLAPPGTRVIVHEKPAVRQSWAPHGVDGG